MLFPAILLLLFTAVLGQHPVHEAPGRLQTRIIGGKYTSVHQVPHQAIIRQSITIGQFTSVAQCGAILISPQWLLTAEHCLHDREITKTPVDAFLGVSRLEQVDHYSPDRTEGVVKRRVVRYFRGPRVEIGNRTEKPDIMLMKLDRKVKTSANIKPIELPEVGDRWINQTAVASGFGKMHDEDIYPANTLQYTKVPILSKSQCLTMIQKKFHKEYQKLRLRVAPETTLCAGTTDGHNVCSGDSGGPLAVCDTPLQETTSGQLMCKDNRWKLAGVAQAILRTCAESNSSALYANVPAFSEWIRRIIRNN